ncbi:cyclase family protein [Neorhodopirellula lusitana]|uniref:cyclase family protein n=1 Tax=Neorhodopirellula lusitana TaxID=445327 RepID=UPI00384E13BF
MSSVKPVQGGLRPTRRGLLVGAGYFSDFHFDAWERIEGMQIVAICDLDLAKAKQAAEKYGIEHVYTNLAEALTRTDLDFVDIATGPTGRLELLEQVIGRGLPVICQKPLANDEQCAAKILEMAQSSGQPFMVHDNFRFQPWYREIKQLIDQGVIGGHVHTITMRTRMGDGWGDDAYLDRQPYFQTMPRLLIQETGVHFIDIFRYLGGEVTECSATLRRLNPVIAGEDAGVMTLRFENGLTATWDANRYNEPSCDNPRYTFGEMWIEGDGGSLSLDSDGMIHVHPLGKPEFKHPYTPSKLGFAGDCVYACQVHFRDVLDGKAACETSPAEYGKTLRAVEAVYESARQDRPVRLQKAKASPASNGRRVIDLSLPVTPEMPGVEITTAKTIEKEGWNATTLSLYSHAGTHMDAPKHFVPGGASLDAQDLSVCCGPARIVSLPDTAPRHLISIDDVTSSVGEVYPGDRLLFQTDWHRQFGTPAYRNELPRISIELAQWLVQQQVALIGVEPPSVADVNQIDELTEVHQTLFRGGVVIVEGLANLDQIHCEEVEFIALPLKIVGGDGCPVRAIAIVDEGGSHER